MLETIAERTLSRSTLTLATTSYTIISEFNNPMIYIYLFIYFADGQVSIGDVTKTIKTPANPELVPIKYCEFHLPT